MVVRVAERARSSGARRVVVATDDSRIADVVTAHGFDAVMTRAKSSRPSSAAEFSGVSRDCAGAAGVDTIAE